MCRSSLSPWKDKDGNYKFYGRFNFGVITLNLVDVACSSNKNLELFWKILEERAEVCHGYLLSRYEYMKDTVSDVAPVMWQHGAIARLKPGEKIGPLLKGGYATCSLGYAGLWETVYYLTGEELITEKGKTLGLQILNKLNELTSKWKEVDDLGYGIYGTPMENATYSFAKSLQKRFGIIKGVTDRKYITNSYHINVTKNIDAFSKLAFESEFQALSTGGAISYIEVPSLKDNIEVVLSIIKFMYDNIMYAEFNTKLDHCMCCGYDKEIKPVNFEGTWKFVCPNCGNSDKSKMDITRRVCGYLSKNDFNQGRLEEIAERVVHVGNGTDYDRQ